MAVDVRTRSPLSPPADAGVRPGSALVRQRVDTTQPAARGAHQPSPGLGPDRPSYAPAQIPQHRYQTPAHWASTLSPDGWLLANQFGDFAWGPGPEPRMQPSDFEWVVEWAAKQDSGDIRELGHLFWHDAMQREPLLANQWKACVEWFWWKAGFTPRGAAKAPELARSQGRDAAAEAEYITAARAAGVDEGSLAFALRYYETHVRSGADVAQTLFGAQTFATAAMLAGIGAPTIQVLVDLYLIGCGIEPQMYLGFLHALSMFGEPAPQQRATVSQIKSKLVDMTLTPAEARAAEASDQAIDDADLEEATRTLRGWFSDGSWPEKKRQLNDELDDALGEELKGQLLGSRILAPDHERHLVGIGNSANMITGLLRLARIIPRHNDVDRTPGESRVSVDLSLITRQKSEIEAVMRSNRKAYDRDTAMQERYRELVDAELELTGGQ